MSELIVLENKTPLEIFSTEGGVDPIIEKIEQEVRSFVPDMTTKEGRKEIASLAYKVARSKTMLDDMGKTLTEDWKRQSAKVDAERRKVRDRLDALKDEVRKPLDEWEAAEEQRIEGHKQAINAIEQTVLSVTSRWQEMPLDEMQGYLKQFQSYTRQWDEFSLKGSEALQSAVAVLEAHIIKRNAHDAEKAELERLRKAEADRLQKEREEKIAQEAADKARREAEEKAEAEKKAAAEKAETERKAAEKKAADEKAEAARKAQAEIDAANAKAAEAKAAQEKAEKDAAEAAEKERKRIADQQAQEQAEAEKRERNRKHKATIHNAAKQALIDSGWVTEEEAQNVIALIAKGQVPHVSIAY